MDGKNVALLSAILVNNISICSVIMHIHLVSFNTPYPADYGGVVDVFHKIKTLHRLGVKIHLHCFDYGRGRAHELDNYCSKVSYYKRPTGLKENLSALPYVVKTRSNRDLLQTLLSDDSPIIFDGLHCTYPLYTNQLSNRKTLVRTHNIEHEYYEGLFSTEKNFIKKIFFYIEAKKLKTYERVLAKAGAIAAISSKDLSHFKNINPNTRLVTPFHPFDKVETKPGKGEYVLIHSDLSVSENILSVEWLLRKVIPDSPHQFIIAGKNPYVSIYKLSKELQNVKIIANPDDTTMSQLVSNAHINLIHSILPQGFKLKLLHSLFKGRHCLCNQLVVQHTGLGPLCAIAKREHEFIASVDELFGEPIDDRMIEERKKQLAGFSNRTQAENLLSMIEHL